MSRTGKSHSSRSQTIIKSSGHLHMCHHKKKGLDVTQWPTTSGVHLCTLGVPFFSWQTIMVLLDATDGSSSKKLKGLRKKPTEFPGVAVLGVSSAWGTCRKPTVTQATRSCTQEGKHHISIFTLNHGSLAYKIKTNYSTIHDIPW